MLAIGSQLSSFMLISWQKASWNLFLTTLQITCEESRNLSRGRHPRTKILGYFEHAVSRLTGAQSQTGAILLDMNNHFLLDLMHNVLSAIYVRVFEISSITRSRES